MDSSCAEPHNYGSKSCRSSKPGDGTSLVREGMGRARRSAIHVRSRLAGTTQFNANGWDILLGQKGSECQPS
jgi:hypothetical protein